MYPCPVCERAVDELHPLPPEVITKDLLAALGDGASPAELRTCAVCLDGLMRAEPRH